jgi:hypothetical protein
MWVRYSYKKSQFKCFILLQSVSLSGCHILVQNLWSFIAIGNRWDLYCHRSSAGSRGGLGGGWLPKSFLQASEQDLQSPGQPQ